MRISRVNRSRRLIGTGFTVMDKSNIDDPNVKPSSIGLVLCTINEIWSRLQSLHRIRVFWKSIIVRYQYSEHGDVRCCSPHRKETSSLA